MRVRQHVNPLSSKFQTPLEPPDWSQIYADPDLPLHLDIGTGKGRFLLQSASDHGAWNFLGVDIREAIIDRANQWRDERNLENLHFLFANINVSLRPILDSLAPGQASQVSPVCWHMTASIESAVELLLLRRWIDECTDAASPYS